MCRGHRADDAASIDEEDGGSAGEVGRAAAPPRRLNAWRSLWEGNLLVCIVIMSKTILGAGRFPSWLAACVVTVVETMIGAL